MNKKVILFLACLAQFIVIVDLAIVNVALPTIGQQMSLTSSALQWIVVAYGLFFGGFLLMGGRLGDVLGRRKVLLSGLTLFTAASLVAGFADSALVLIAARAVQGLGAALIAPSALGILASTFAEGKERAKALGVFGAVGGAAGSVGVVASGLLTDGPGWQWIFFINIPLGALLIALALKNLPKETRTKNERIDVLGAASVTGGLLAFIYGLNHAVEAGWTSPLTLGAFAVAILLFVVFWRSESRSSDPLVPFAALKNRTSSASLLIGLFTFGALFAFIYMTSLYMQQQLHFSPTQTGVAWLVMSVSSFAASIFTGAKLLGRLSIKQLLFISLSAMVVGVLWILRAPAEPMFMLDIVPTLLLMGIGGGMAIPAIQVGALTGVEPKRVGLISGLAETTRELGAVVIIAGVTTAIVMQDALLAGFRAGFAVIASAAILAIVIAAVVFRKK
ncbi:MAG TPA: MFS transporter [Candidatus Saccharimonadales bacterium]|nr:MFS transporter [Candidatus Saccharimonadales bacterium]